MHTIYSKIIWEKLNLKDYKIHEESSEKTDELIFGWINDNSLEDVQKFFFNELSPISKITSQSWYDGQFYGIVQKSDEFRTKREDGSLMPDLILHDNDLIPSMLFMAMKTGMSPEDFIFMGKILEKYYEKNPPHTWRNDMDEDEEF